MSTTRSKRAAHSGDAHLARLSPDARDAIEQLNNDARIGVMASKGDGDLASWHHVFLCILELEFSRTEAGLHRREVPQFELAPPSVKVQGETKGQFALRILRSDALAFVDGIYVDLSHAQRSTWQQLYDDVLAVEMAIRWGGRAIRFQARLKGLTGPKPAAKIIEDGIADGTPLRDVFAAAGVSPATGYRILNRKQPRRT